MNNVLALGQGASKYHDAGNSTGNITVNFNNGNNQKLTLTGAVNLGFSNPISGANYTLVLVQGGSGSYTVTWPASVLWPSGVDPILSTAIGAVDAINLLYDGTNYLGTVAYNFS
jgi:hypothetical protein